MCHGIFVNVKNVPWLRKGWKTLLTKAKLNANLAGYVEKQTSRICNDMHCTWLACFKRAIQYAKTVSTNRRLVCKFFPEQLVASGEAGAAESLF